jgi:hypothetical protein
LIEVLCDQPCAHSQRYTEGLQISPH